LKLRGVQHTSDSLDFRHFSRMWGQGRLGAGACASEIFGVGQSSNVTATSGKHYFHQSHFYLCGIIFIQRKIYLLRIFRIYPASISVKEGLFPSK